MDEQIINQINSFWLGDNARDLASVKQRTGLWFNATPDFDRHIQTEYEALVLAAARGELKAWELSVPGQLALIILLDQFPRNIYRHSAQAFQYDHLALAITQRGVTTAMACLAKELSWVERGAYYMPLQHSEDLAMQTLSVECYQALMQSADTEDWREFLLGFENSARQHRHIVQQFGRFPHRNALVGRPSTVEEQAYLADGGARFGQ